MKKGVVKMELPEKIISLHLKYINEMMAEGAWCGHCYATTYFSYLRTQMITTAKEIEKTFRRREDVSKLATHLLFTLNTDYDALIEKVYSDNTFESDDKHVIAEALNDAFITKLENAFGEFSYIYMRN